MNKSQFGTYWSKLVKKYRCGTEIIGNDRSFILENCSKSTTYKKNSLKENLKIKARLIKIAGGRKVKMICLESPGTRQPISKSKLVEQLYPTKKRAPESKSQGVRGAMRNMVKEQIHDYRRSLKFPIICPVSLLEIKKGSKYDVDHYDKPFVQIADEFIISKGLDYNEIELKGPQTSKTFKDEELIQEWSEYHKENSNLKAVISKYNRSKGCSNYKSPF